MNWREYTKYEVDPVTGYNNDPLNSHDEKDYVRRNVRPESVSKKERERELEERLSSFSVLSILKEAIGKAELLVNNTESRIANQTDIHNSYSLLGTAKGWEDYFKSEKFSGDFLELKSKDKEAYQYIFNLLIDLNY